MAKYEFEPLLGAPSTGVVITGGAAGIGHASAEAVAAVGRPVALWDINAERVEAAASELKKEYGVTAIGLGVDVRDHDAILKAAAETRDRLPSIGGLVHCAGFTDTASLEGVTVETWDEGMNLHVRPIPLMIQAFLADLKKYPGAAIVATASINASIASGMNPIYTAAKGAVVSLVRSLADRLARDGIRVNTLSPGYTATAMMKKAVEEGGADMFLRQIMLARLGEPAELGRMVRFLLSDEASYITATEFIIDGGVLSAQR